MSIPDYLRFEDGNPVSATLVGEWFETTGLFGYFEKYNVHADGTIWFTPTQMAPTGRMQPGIEAEELAKVDRKPVRIILDEEITLLGETGAFLAQFVDGILRSIRPATEPPRNVDAAFVGFCGK